MANDMVTIILIGFACIFIPLVVIGIAFLGGVEWNTVGQYVAIPILTIFIIGIMVFYLRENL